MARPTTGVFIAWDEEEVDVERLDAGTIHDRTVVTGRRTVVKQALYTSTVNEKTVAAAQEYVKSQANMGYDNLRVQVFTKTSKRA